MKKKRYKKLMKKLDKVINLLESYPRVSFTYPPTTWPEVVFIPSVWDSNLEIQPYETTYTTTDN